MLSVKRAIAMSARYRLGVIIVIPRFLISLLNNQNENITVPGRNASSMKFALTLLLFLLCTLPAAAAVKAEDGHDLWLRYAPLGPEQAEPLRAFTQGLISTTGGSTTRELARRELKTGLDGLLGIAIPDDDTIVPGSIVLARPGEFEPIDRFDLPWDALGNEGYLIRRLMLDDGPFTLVAANADIGLLYGAFALLRHFQLAGSRDMDIIETPAIDLRLLNHWDNLDRSVERGYAGQSLWDWWRLPDYIDPRYTDYARANASLGINGAVLNNVNSNAQILTERYLKKVAAIADTLRPWGMRVYLSARFSAPQELGDLTTPDPLDPHVQAWWHEKAAEIYALIPDFGGFLVKANSEGQPGPQDFGRTHADGANLLADALAPYGGVVMWRAFVYSDVNPEDRAKQAWSEFKPLDGQFAANVILQVKNGPIDFQPREPFHPMFGAFPATPLMLELQITKEYLGFATHLAYLGPMYQEVLQTDTYTTGEGATVAKVIDGSLHGHGLTGIAGVSGIGADRDWMGSDFNQANWYVFGKLAWNPALASDAVAREWLALTFSDDPLFLDTATKIMMRSREAVVNYMTPLGLAHLMGTGHHYGPAPWVSELGRPEWNPVYYHRADRQGIGFDRTATGSDALSQYASEVAAAFADPATMDERFLLWFHHLPWDHTMQSGRSLWEELVSHYDKGVEDVARMQADWRTLEPFVDPERFAKAAQFLKIQLAEARWWRDACLAYFMSVSGLPLPAGVQPPEHSLDYYRSLRFPNAPG